MIRNIMITRDVMVKVEERKSPRKPASKFLRVLDRGQDNGCYKT
jgi:hypothetical protein